MKFLRETKAEAEKILAKVNNLASSLVKIGYDIDELIETINKS